MFVPCLIFEKTKQVAIVLPPKPKVWHGIPTKPTGSRGAYYYGAQQTSADQQELTH